MTDWTLEDAERSNARIESGEPADEMAEGDARKAWKSAGRPTQNRPSGAKVVESVLLERHELSVSIGRPAVYVIEKYDSGSVRYVRPARKQTMED